MKAILVGKDKHLIWTDVPMPVPEPDEVLIEIHAAALNRADLMQRDGNYPPPPGAPEWMGLEVSGIIREMGKTALQESHFSVGDAVCALLGGGGYAEYVAVRHDMLMPIPKGCSFAEAAALPEAFATSYLNLFLEGGAKAGDTVLVTGGAGGLSSVMIPMAKSAGLRVLATVRSAHKAEAVRALGADVVVNTSQTSLAGVLTKEAEAGHPVSLAVDSVGGADVGDCLAQLAHGARWVMIAAQGGEVTPINLRTVYVKNIRIIGSTLRSRTSDFKAELLRLLVRDMWDKVAARTLLPTIYRVLPITEAEEAQELLYQGKNIGKVVLSVR